MILKQLKNKSQQLYKGFQIKSLQSQVAKQNFSSGFKGFNLQKKKPLIDEKVNKQHYDVAIIGGGSGGLAFAFEAQKLGLKAVVFDYVEESTQGNSWGLGGTCVNVGCIPKKLMHTAALYKEVILNSSGYGFDLEGKNLEEKYKQEYLVWQHLVNNVQSYIKSINFGYKKSLGELNIDYVNAFASFYDKNTLIFSPKVDAISGFLKDNESYKANTEQLGYVTADKIVVAVGGRPQLLSDNQCENSYKYAITSDDIFMQKKPPGKTLVVGGGYIALECSGFLSTLGYDTTMMTRSLYLREFDQDIAQMILENIQSQSKVKVVPTSLPVSLEKVDEDTLKVRIQNQEDKSKIYEDTFNTVLMAIGRKPNTQKLNLEKVGVQLNQKNKKIQGRFNEELEQTSVEGIYALGDVLDGVPELTPVAQKQGQLLARRIQHKKENKEVNTVFIQKNSMDYNDFPTTVFTPIEYSCAGYSEKQAIEKFGEENIEVYHSKFTPLEEQLSPRVDENFDTIYRKAYAKVICNKLDHERVVGIHYLGPNAGEVMQGYGVAMKLGMTKADLDRTVGIHPTTAEEFTSLSITKASGEDCEKTSC
ncbi:hypothetical protein ABPG74_012733 [Tetrahymena malaccensis]